MIYMPFQDPVGRNMNTTGDQLNPKLPHPIGVALAFAGVAFLAVVLVAVFIANDPEIFGMMAFNAPFAAGIITPWVWGPLLRTKYSVWRAAGSGALIGTLSHPVAWYTMFLVHWISNLPYAVSDSQIIDPINSMWAIGVFAFWSLIIAGWITIPIGCITGIVIWWLTR
ncbi:hypothetical protein TI04_08230 [Achromatium sp. WMS2]|nr:hypothetical protein TI04_08230 [Achromatium sp. WMS2]